jgi:hypothetical protein
MWAVHLALSLMTVYAAIIAGMYLAQTWLLFPTALARIARVRTPASTQRLEVQTSDGESLIGVRIRGTASGRPTLLGFGGNAWNAKVIALTLHNLRTVDAGHNDVYDHPAFAAAMREALATIEAA